MKPEGHVVPSRGDKHFGRFWELGKTRLGAAIPKAQFDICG